jgi:hypothetical protein
MTTALFRPSLRALCLSLSGALALAATACDPPEEEKTPDETAGETDSDPGPDDPSASSTTGPEMPERETEGGSETEGDTEDECSFIGCGDDTGIIEPLCSVWEQDCPDGEKCMPWANDGGNSWNATKCVPVDPNPGQPGDACTVEGSGVSGVDTCDISAMCWNVDPETNEGTCVDFCAGSEANPVCDNPSTTCSILNEGALILCLPECNPLTQDCADGEACYPADQGFICAPNAAPDESGNYGDPCEFVNVCNPGLLCANAAGIPGCTGSLGCCTEFCSLADAQPSAACSGVSGGQECLPAFEEGSAPPEYVDVGLCLLPE